LNTKGAVTITIDAIQLQVAIIILSMEKGDFPQVVQQQEQKEQNGRSEMCICCEGNLLENYSIVTWSYY